MPSPYSPVLKNDNKGRVTMQNGTGTFRRLPTLPIFALAAIPGMATVAAPKTQEPPAASAAILASDPAMCLTIAHAQLVTLPPK
jgi:hypothetical protein